MNLDVTIPDQLVDVIEQEPEWIHQNAVFCLVAIFYQAGQISGHVAAQRLDMEPSEFYQLLDQHGFPIPNNSEKGVGSSDANLSDETFQGLTINPLTPGSGYTQTSIEHDTVLAEHEG